MCKVDGKELLSKERVKSQLGEASKANWLVPDPSCMMEHGKIHERHPFRDRRGVQRAGEGTWEKGKGDPRAN